MKILWISPFFLHPTNRGGQIRTLGTLKELHRHHEVHFCALNPPDNPEGPARSSEYCSRAFEVRHAPTPRSSIKIIPELLQAIASPIPMAVSRYASQELRTLVQERLSTEHYDCVVCDFLACAPNLSDMARAVLFEHNVETTIWQRHEQQATSWPRKLFFGMQARKMARYERNICRQSRFVIAVSELDAKRMREDFGIEHVAAVRTGVDVDFLQPPEASEPVGDLMFSGSMDWLPNVDAMEYFLDEIFPLILAQRPATTLTIAGRSPDARVTRAAATYPGVTVTGSVPDMRPYLWGSSLSIIPLRIGGGTRLKVYESMAAGTPIVSTTVGAEGLEYSDGKDIVIADTPRDFADACLHMLENDARRSQIARAARQLVIDNFSWSAVTPEFAALLEQNSDKEMSITQ
ncbi:MAG: glycosyltransferase family 4 protein [Terriglobus sp.]